MKKLMLSLTVLFSAVRLTAAPIDEHFGNMAGLPGVGWSFVNLSTAGGSTSWFQGNSNLFPAYDGAPNSYVAANFNAAGAGGNISLWLLTPVFTFNNGDPIRFYTRTDSNASFGDALELRLSTNGASSNVGATTASVGDFSTLLLTVAAGTYPTGWTLYNTTVAGLAGTATGRLGFRYTVMDTNLNGDYIGIDAVTAGVPEPAAAMLVPMGLATLAILRRRRR